MFSVVVNSEEKFVFYRFSMLEIVETKLIDVLSLPSILEEMKGNALIPSEICVWRGKKILKESRKLHSSLISDFCFLQVLLK